jgi:hypothetical protein
MHASCGMWNPRSPEEASLLLSVTGLESKITHYQHLGVVTDNEMRVCLDHLESIRAILGLD